MYIMRSEYCMVCPIIIKTLSEHSNKFSANSNERATPFVHQTNTIISLVNVQWLALSLNL